LSGFARSARRPRSAGTWIVITALTFGVRPAYATRAQSSDAQDTAGKSAPPENKPGEGSPAEGSPTGELSAAERIARLNRVIEEDEHRLEKLQGQLDDPQGDYVKAERGFQELDGQLQARKKDLEKARQGGRTDDAAALETEVADIEQRWKLAKDRFDLAIEERRTLQEQIATLQKKVQQDRRARDQLLAPRSPASQPAAGSPTGAAATPPPSSASPPGAAPPAGTTQEASPGTPPPAGPEPQQGIAPPSGAAPPAAATPSGAPAASSSPADGEAKAAPSPKELVEAKQEAESKAGVAQQAEAQAQSVKQRMDALRKNVELERSLLETARKKADNAQQTQRTLSEQARKRAGEGAPQDEQRDLWSKADEARRRYQESAAEVQERVDRLDTLQEELSQLQAEQIAALREAERTGQAAEEARQKVKWLENPFAPRNLWRWLLLHGPRMAGIILAMFAILWITRLAEGRMIRLIAVRTERGSPEERENRARTLVAVFHNATRIMIYAAGILMLLAEIGVNILPLMGGAAVLGLAVAFGAQNLIRDYFSGFMILLENQYGINDVVKIGSHSGLVERITLRITALRDLDGTMHFIPNGQISTVSNMTHEWSRALFDIGIGYGSDVDQAMEVLMELARELRRDPAFARVILDDPEMLGVDELGDSAVVIKFYIRTRPLKQWTVKREMLRRVKKRFDELSIEIPFPHRTVYHRYEPGFNPPSAPENTSRRGD